MSIQVALSIQQPYAWAILYAGKDIENREWFTHFRGRVLIHVGKRYDIQGSDFIRNMFHITIPSDLPLGGVIGSVEIVDCVTQSKSKWFFGKHGFVLSNPQKMDFFPCRGQLGFFKVEIP